MYTQVRSSGERVTNSVALLCVEFGQPCFEMSRVNSSEGTEGNHEDMTGHNHIRSPGSERKISQCKSRRWLSLENKEKWTDVVSSSAWDGLYVGKSAFVTRSLTAHIRHQWRQWWTRIQPSNNRLGTASPMAFYPLRQDSLKLPFSAMGNAHFHLWRKLGSMTWPLLAASCATTDSLRVLNQNK